jgi:hypothetical protein
MDMGVADNRKQETESREQGTGAEQEKGITLG